MHFDLTGNFDFALVNDFGIDPVIRFVGRVDISRADEFPESLPIRTIANPNQETVGNEHRVRRSVTRAGLVRLVVFDQLREVVGNQDLLIEIFQRVDRRTNFKTLATEVIRVCVVQQIVDRHAVRNQFRLVAETA